jgi:hypothetical protein
MENNLAFGVHALPPVVAAQRYMQNGWVIQVISHSSLVRLFIEPLDTPYLTPTYHAQQEKKALIYGTDAL